MCIDLETAALSVNTHPTYYMNGPRARVSKIAFSSSGANFAVDELTVSTEKVEVVQTSPRPDMGTGGQGIGGINVTTLPSDGSSGSSSVTHRITLAHSPCTSQYPGVEVAALNSSSSSSVATARRVSVAGAPASGTFLVGLDGVWTTTPLEVDVTAAVMKSALESLTTVGSKYASTSLVNVDRTGNCNGFTWRVTFASNPGDVTMMTVDSSTPLNAALGGEGGLAGVSVGISGSDAAVTVREIIKGGFDAFPIPDSMLLQAQTEVLGQAELSVTVGGRGGKCSSGAGCKFHFDAAAAPLLQAIEPSAGYSGDLISINVTGSDLTAPVPGDGSSAQPIQVSVGRWPCAVQQAVAGASDSSMAVQCRLQAGCVAGRHAVAVRFPHQGFAILADAGAAGTFDCALSPLSVSPAVGSVAGGQIVRISGHGFSAVAFENEVTIGGRVCTPLQSFSTSASGAPGFIECLTTSSLVDADGGSDEAVIVSVAEFGAAPVALAGTFTHSMAATPQVTGAVSPVSGSAGGGAVLTITGSGFDAASGGGNMTVTLGDAPVDGGSAGGATAVVCPILNITATEITCRAPPVPRGTHAVVVRNLLQGLAHTASDADGVRLYSGGRRFPTFTAVLRVDTIAPATVSVRGGARVAVAGAGFYVPPTGNVSSPLAVSVRVPLEEQYLLSVFTKPPRLEVQTLTAEATIQQEVQTVRTSVQHIQESQSVLLSLDGTDSFRLDLFNCATAPIHSNASAAAIKTAIESLANVVSADVVSHAAPSGFVNFTVTFQEVDKLALCSANGTVTDAGIKGGPNATYSGGGGRRRRLLALEESRLGGANWSALEEPLFAKLGGAGGLSHTDVHGFLDHDPEQQVVNYGDGTHEAYGNNWTADAAAADHGRHGQFDRGRGAQHSGGRRKLLFFQEDSYTMWQKKEWKPIRIVADFRHVVEGGDLEGKPEKYLFLKDRLVPTAIAFMQAALSVVPVQGALRLASEGGSCGGLSVFDEHRSPGVDADMLLYISAKPAEQGVIAFSTQCMMDQVRLASNLCSSPLPPSTNPPTDQDATASNLSPSCHSATANPGPDPPPTVREAHRGPHQHLALRSRPGCYGQGMGQAGGHRAARADPRVGLLGALVRAVPGPVRSAGVAGDGGQELL